MERIRAERTVVRRIFSRACTALDQELKKEEVDYESACAKMRTVEYEAQKLFEIDEEMKAALFAEEIDEEYQVKEFEDMSDYRSKFFLFSQKFKTYDRSVKETREYVDAHSVVSVDGQHVMKSKRNFKLPKIEQKKFDGELRNWLGFWGQFKVIDESPDITDSDKFQYLLQGTVVGSKARQVVEGFPPSGENYHKALAYLKERFAKDEFLIEAYYRELLTLVIQQASCKTDISLSDLFDRLSTQLRALESLGVTKEKYAAMLFPMVESCLPVDILKAWGRFRLTPTAADIGSQKTPDSMLTNLMDFLKAEVENDERIRLASDGFSAESKTSAKRSEAIPTAATILSVENSMKPRVFSCIFCGKSSHNSQDCVKALNMQLKARREIVVEKNACFSCLKEGHSADRCRSFVRCPVCSRKHYAIVCAEILKNRTPEEHRKHSTSVNQNNTSKPSSGIVLQTLLVNAKGSHKSKVLRVLLDSGSQRSYVASSIAKELKLKDIRKEAITHCLFGGVTSKPEEHSLYEVELTSLKGDKSIKIQVLDQAVICNSVPRIHNFDRLQELNTKNIVLTDVGPEVPNITLLLGADVIGKLLTGRIETLASTGMVFVETILGWTAMGEYAQRDLALVCSSNLNISDLWDLETLGIPTSDTRPDSNNTWENFQRTVTQGKDGRYEVQLPWLTGRPQLSCDLGIAQRLFSEVGEEQFSERFAYFSRYSRIDRMVAWVIRFWKSRKRSRKQQEVGQERLIVFKNRKRIFKLKIEKDFDKKEMDLDEIKRTEGTSEGNSSKRLLKRQKRCEWCCLHVQYIVGCITNSFHHFQLPGFEASKTLSSLVNWDKICSFSDQKFNPPIAAWWGGWWERVMRMIKELMRRNLGQAALTYEALTTVTCDIEAVINARPLTYVGGATTSSSRKQMSYNRSPRSSSFKTSSQQTPDFDTLPSGDPGTGWDQHAESSTVKLFFW